MTRPEGRRGGGGGQPQPAAAVEAPHHTGHLAVANTESASVDVDEEDEDIVHPDPLPMSGGLRAVADRGPNGDPWGDGNTTTPLAALPLTPGVGGGRNGTGSSTGDPPIGAALGTGPPPRHEGVFWPTAHESPGQGNGPESPPGGGGGGGGRGPHTGVGRWRYGSGHSRRGTATTPRAELGPERAKGLPPPSPWVGQCQQTKQTTSAA